MNNQLIEAVNFEKADILDDIDKLKKDNTILMFRNVWPYLNEKEQKTLATGLGKNLGDNSMCVIGNFDTQSTVTNSLSDAGFKPLNNLYYLKNGSSTQKAMHDPEFLMNTFATKN